MITFKQFLNERAENMRAYRKVFKANSTALVGFEVEVFIPRTHDFAQDGPTAEKRSSTDIRRFDTYAEFEDYFKIDRSQERSIDSDYDTWVEDQKEQYIKNNLNDDTTEDDLSDRFDEIKDDEYSWTKWFEHDFRNAADFVNTYDLEPRYGWEDEGSRVWDEALPDLKSNWKEDIGDLIADTLERRYLKGKKVEYGQPGEGDGKTFMVVPDSSIGAGDDEDQGYGAEIVTPPLPVQEALDCLSRIFDFIDDQDMKTNATTGLHINISVPNMDKLDAVKLVVMMGDEHVLSQFDRRSNSMTRSQMRFVRSEIDKAMKTGRIPTKSEMGFMLQRIAIDVLAAGKYNSVNFDKLKDGYLEFRSAGNKDYHRDFSSIEQLVGRWVQAMTLACDPDEDRNLYLKRLAKIFNETGQLRKDDDLSLFDLFKKNIAGGYANALANADTKEKLERALVNISQQAFSGQPNARQIKELRLAMKKYGVQTGDILASSMDRQRTKEFLERFKLM